MSFLLATTVTVGFNLASSPAFWVFLICLIGVVLLFLWTLIRQILFNRKSHAIQQNLKVGDSVKTFGGVEGKVVDIIDSPDGKMVTLETGKGKHVGYLTVDIKAIFTLVNQSNESEK
ncbi:MAG: preprotein translocase subunit YajC [Clostridia bacterium]|nr:preprotein translocase subunit YajC [Clostridia bacterium]